MRNQSIKLRNGLSICYRESGNGDIPVLFVPGWSMSSEVFQRQFEFFANSDHYRFLSLDPRSHGNSSKKRNGNNYEQHGRDLHQFMSTLDLERIVLGGWSFGTLAILSYVKQFGFEKLSGLIMIDGPPKAAGRDNKKEWVSYRYDDADRFQEFCTMGKLRNAKEFGDQFARWMLEIPDDNVVRWLADLSGKMPNEAAALLNASAVFLDYRAELIETGKYLPLLFIVRKNRKQCVHKWARENTPDAEIHAFGEHMMFWERSERFNLTLEEYLEKCR